MAAAAASPVVKADKKMEEQDGGISEFLPRCLLFQLNILISSLCFMKINFKS